jgi:hypothetical protein
MLNHHDVEPALAHLLHLIQACRQMCKKSDQTVKLVFMNR